MDSNNRQLHEEELERIEKLAGGDEEKRKRLTIAACALVKCYAEYPEGSLAYPQLKVISDGGASETFAQERALLMQQKGLFEYTTTGLFSDQRADNVRQFNNTYQAGTRALGVVQAAAGAVETVGAVVIGATTCETGVGCAVALAVGAYGVDTYFSGANTAATGVPQATVLNQGLQKLGLDETSATYVEMAAGTAGAISLGRFALASTKVGVGAGFSADELAEIGAKAPAEREVDLNFYKDSIKAENAPQPITSQGQANAASYLPLKEQLAAENLANISAVDTRLALAVRGSNSKSSNFSIGSGTTAEADSLGRIWVGDGAKLVQDQVSCPGCLISADGTRLYRPPSAKPNTPRQFNPTGVQANFVRRSADTGTTISNGHLVVTP